MSLLLRLNETETSFFPGVDGLNISTLYDMYDTQMVLNTHVSVLERFVKPAIFTVGIVTNLFLACVVMCCPKLAEFAPMVYVGGIGLADLGYLVFSVFTWLQMNFKLALYHTVGMCQLINYCVKAFTFLTRWYMAAFSAERFTWEILPERRAEFCNVFKTKLVLIGTAVLAVYGHVYLCWFLEASEETNYMCIVHHDNLGTFNTLLRIDMVVAYLIPYAVTIILTFAVLWKKVRCNRKKKEDFCQSLKETYRRQRPQIVDDREKRIKPLHASAIVICYTASLLVLTIPLNTGTLIGVMFSQFPFPYSWTPYLAAMLDLHFAGKPLICFICSPKVRHSGKKLVLRCFKKVWRRGDSVANSTVIDMDEVNLN